MSQTKVTDAVRDTTVIDGTKINAVDATKLTGSVDVARLPSTVLNSNVPATDTSALEYNIAILAFKVASANQLAKFSMVDQVIDEYQKPIGTVSDVLVMPAQNIIVVETEENEILIPYVDAHITLFDRQKKNLIVRDVVGLIN